MVFGTQLVVIVRLYPTGCDGVDGNVPVGKRKRQCVGERIDATFRGSVCFAARFAHLLAGGGDIHDSAVRIGRTLSPAMEGEQPGGDEYGAEIGGEYAVELLDAGFGNGAETADAYVVDDAVHIAPLLEELLHTAFQCFCIAYINGEEGGSGFLCRLIPGRLVVVAEGHPATVPAKRFNDGFTNSSGSSADEYSPLLFLCYLLRFALWRGGGGLNALPAVLFPSGFAGFVLFVLFLDVIICHNDIAVRC